MLKKILNKLFTQYASKWLVLLFDLVVVAFTFFLAYIIRFNIALDFDFFSYLKQLPVIVFVALISFLAVGTHKGVVRFTGIKDITNTIIGVNILATLLFVTTYIARKFNLGESFDISGSIIYIHLLLNIFFLVASKFFIKYLYRTIATDTKKLANVLIYGAGSSGLITYEAITNDARSNMRVVGFVDDNTSKIGKTIDRIKVLNPEKITKEFIEKHAINEVIISIQKISSTRLLELAGSFFSYSLKVKIVPPVKQWIDGDLSIGQIKDVKIEDLLGREQINIINPVLVDEYENQVILVSGAAGSISTKNSF